MLYAICHSYAKYINLLPWCCFTARLLWASLGDVRPRVKGRLCPVKRIDDIVKQNKPCKHNRWLYLQNGQTMALWRAKKYETVCYWPIKFRNWFVNLNAYLVERGIAQKHKIMFHKLGECISGYENALALTHLGVSDRSGHNNTGIFASDWVNYGLLKGKMSVLLLACYIVK